MNCNHEENSIKCASNGNDVYGGYCKKHRKQYLLHNNSIIINRFTKNDKDYSLVELKEFYNRVLKTEKTSSFKKQDYFKRVNEYHSKYSSITVKGLIKFQAFIRMKIIDNKIKLRGLSVINRDICNNDEDFYTYTPKEEIEDIYFFSYKDAQHNVWCFDIRSLKKLIDMNYDNPYTTEEIPNNIKCLVKNYMNKLL